MSEQTLAELLSMMSREELLRIAEEEYALVFTKADSDEAIIEAIVSADEAKNSTKEQEEAEEIPAAEPAPEFPPRAETEKSKSENPAPKTESGQKRLSHPFLRGGRKITIGKDTVQADENGVIEVAAAEAARLLSIGYKEV